MLDTNVLVSGLAYPDSTPGRVVTAWRQGRFDLVTSEHQLGEIGHVLAYRKVRRRLECSDPEIAAFLKQLLLRSELVDAKAVEHAGVDEARDPDDHPILAILRAAGADCLVTGDRDLLVLRERYTTLTPAEFASTL